MKYFSINAPNFSLTHTLECGQVFRWERLGNNEYAGVIGSSIIRLRQEGSTLLVWGSGHKLTPSYIKVYFDLTLDLAYIYNKIGKDNEIKGAISKFRGLRVIRQPLWECLASFIISTQNNIPRIKKIIEKLCRCFGNPILGGDTLRYSFPEPGQLANLKDYQLEGCGAGYRANYLIKTARDFVDKKISFESLRNKPYISAKEYLMRLRGVGPKVADCTLLFALGKFEAFPVDVWIKRVMERLYFNSRNTKETEIRRFASAYFGAYAGYAQQYLYHYARTKSGLKGNTGEKREGKGL